VGVMLVTEIFHSIQGESSYTGLPCVFVRLTGCPLRCSWCDTNYIFYGGTQMTLEAVLERVQQYDCRLVEVTGGEPLHQPEARPLVHALCDEGYDVLIETSGAVDVSGVDPRARLVMDVKCPGSHMSDRMVWTNLERLRRQDEVKFVISDRADYDWAVSIVQRHHLTSRCTVLFGPVFGKLEPRQLAEWILTDRLQVRFQMQLHKYVWHPDMRGV
jgi:7-carboxy-7-deazaguanine synthase